MAAFVFLFLICYEIFILKGPLLGKVGRAVPSSSARLIHPFINTSKSITTSPSLSSRPSRDDSSKKNADNSLKKRKTSVGPSKSSSDQNNASPPPSPYPKIISAGTTAADTPTSTTGNANKVSQYAERSISPQEEQKARVSSYKPLRRKKYSKLSKRRKHRAPSVLNIERHAADEDDTSSSGKETKNKRKTIRGSKSIVHSSQPSAADEDTPPTRTKRTSENGAEPGAGENFWQWFQDTKGSEKQGVSISIPCPEENKRLCEMFYKYLRKYKIRCIYDVSCGKNYDWMPAVVKKAGNELWGFKYYCSVSDGEDVDAAKQKLGKFKFVEFVTDPWWKTGYPEDTELLFAWDTLAHIAYGRVWNFFVKAKKQEVKYLLVDNYPGILNDPVRCMFCLYFQQRFDM